MSYILDALRRADSERERGAVPGVHAQALPPGPADLDAPPPARHWLAVSVVLGVLLVAALAWQFFAAGRAPEAAPVAAPTPAPTPLPVTEPPAAVPPVVAAAPAPAPASVAAPVVPPAARVVPKPVAPATPRPAAVPPAARPVPAAREPAPPAAPPPPARIPMSNELPDELQRALPALQIGGASYSQNADSRMLIVNGQVMREGDKLSADVTLEQIRLKEAVLSVRGTRFRIAY